MASPCYHHGPLSRWKKVQRKVSAEGIKPRAINVYPCEILQPSDWHIEILDRSHVDETTPSRFWLHLRSEQSECRVLKQDPRTPLWDEQFKESTSLFVF